MWPSGALNEHGSPRACSFLARPPRIQKRVGDSSAVDIAIGDSLGFAGEDSWHCREAAQSRSSSEEQVLEHFWAPGAVALFVDRIGEISGQQV